MMRDFRILYAGSDNLFSPKYLAYCRLPSGVNSSPVILTKEQVGEIVRYKNTIKTQWEVDEFEQLCIRKYFGVIYKYEY